MRLIKVIVAVLAILAPAQYAKAAADTALAYETVEPARIKLGESATIQITSFDSYLQNIELPIVTGLAFEMIGRSEGLEFVNGTAIPATFIQIRVTPQFVGDFTIPALLPNSRPFGLEVVNGDEPNPFSYPSQKPAPLPVAPVALPKGVRLRAGGAAFVQLLMPTRAVYVGESVPVEIALGVRPGIVTSVNGLPTLNGSDFTLDNLSKHPKDREQDVGGSIFRVWSWNSMVAAIKPGEFSLAVDTPLSAKINTLSANGIAFASLLRWPFSQITYNSITPKDITITSPSSKLKVLALPTEGQPKDFSGAVGTFRVSSDVSPARVAVGDPLTLRLHISGAGNFDRVDATMFDHLDQWKTYPAKSSFTHSDEVGYRGEKVFEQSLIAARPGEQTIPGLEFSYFNPNTRHYERVHTSPIKVTVFASSSAGLAGALAQTLGGQFARGLRPDHSRLRRSVSEMRPLYFQAAFLAVPATLALILAGSWFVLRPNPLRATSKAAERALAQLEAAARSGDACLFFQLARQTLLRTFAARWQMAPDQITSPRLRARLGAAGEDIERLFALADEAKYSNYEPGSTDFQRWLRPIRDQLAGERA